MGVEPAGHLLPVYLVVTNIHLNLLSGVLDRLRSPPELAGMEMLLAYIAGLVLDKRDVLDLMRWNMGRATGMTFYEEFLLEVSP